MMLHYNSQIELVNLDELKIPSYFDEWFTFDDKVFCFDFFGESYISDIVSVEEYAKLTKVDVSSYDEYINDNIFCVNPKLLENMEDTLSLIKVLKRKEKIKKLLKDE